MSQAELKKLEELKRLKREAKLKKQQEANEQAEKMNQIQIKADSLPPVALKRRGQFEMIPDFLQKETQKDLNAVAEQDFMAASMAKQDLKNFESGPSMSELFKQKTMETEKLLESKTTDVGGKGKLSEQEVLDRKARLQANRDKLRKIQEDKRQQELEEFKSKTETKSDLFNELKKMDDNMKSNISSMKKDVDNERRLEMFRKAREDTKKESQQENEQAYQKRVTQMDQKDGKVETLQDDWLKGMKAHKLDDD